MEGMNPAVIEGETRLERVRRILAGRKRSLIQRASYNGVSFSPEAGRRILYLFDVKGWAIANVTNIDERSSYTYDTYSELVRNEAEEIKAEGTYMPVRALHYVETRDTGIEKMEKAGILFPRITFDFPFIADFGMIARKRDEKVKFTGKESFDRGSSLGVLFFIPRRKYVAVLSEPISSWVEMSHDYFCYHLANNLERTNEAFRRASLEKQMGNRSVR